MTDKLEIKREFIPFNRRIGGPIQISLFVISFGIIIYGFIIESISLVDFVAVMSLLFGIIIVAGIFRTKNYLYEICIDESSIEIKYLNYSDEKIIRTTLDQLELEIMNTSSRAGFDCKLILRCESKTLTIRKQFDWIYEDLKKVFTVIKNNKNEILSEREKLIVSKLSEKIIEVPF